MSICFTKTGRMRVYIITRLFHKYVCICKSLHSISRFLILATSFYFIGLPLDHKFPRFKHEDDGNTDGFSPAKPKPLMPL